MRFASQERRSHLRQPPSTNSRPNVWGRTLRFRHSKSRPNPEEETAPATATTDAAIQARFRSAIPPLRCRWKRTPATSSNGCLVRAILRKSARDSAKQYASILDVISQESAGLKRRVGAEDRVMLDEYLETIREIERRVQKMEQSDLSKLDLPDAPAGIPNSFDEHLNLMFDLVALAYRQTSHESSP